VRWARWPAPLRLAAQLLLELAPLAVVGAGAGFITLGPSAPPSWRRASHSGESSGALATMLGWLVDSVSATFVQSSPLICVTTPWYSSTSLLRSPLSRAT